jgi:tetratricopeptide (TPR) repeat protein
VAQWQGDPVTARSLHETSLATWREIGTAWGAANALNGLGLFARDRGEYGAARRYFAESLALRRTEANAHAVASSLNHLAVATLHDGDPAAARALLDEALDVARRHDHQAIVANALGSLGTLARIGGNYEEARHRFERAIAIERGLGNDVGIGLLLEQFAVVALCEGEAGTALALLRRAWAHLVGASGGTAGRVLDRAIGAGLLEHAACAIAALGDAPLAVRLAAAAERVRTATGTVPCPADRHLLHRWIASARACLDRTTQDAEEAAGTNLSLEEALTQALGPPDTAL